MPDLQHLSYSSISTFLACPKSWEFRYVLKVETPTSPELVFGSSFHDTVEQIVAGRSAAGEIATTWTTNWQRRTEGQQIDWGTDTPEYFCNEGVRILTAEPIRQAIHELTCGMDAEGPKVERKVTLSVPGVPVPIIGYIDLIDHRGVPHDLKTSGRSWTADKAQSELQPLFYLAALNQAGIRVPNLEFTHVVFVKTKTPQVQVLRHRHTMPELVWLMTLIGKAWKAIESEAYFPNPGSWKCSPQWCEYWRLCRGKYL